jgi:CDP-4-dehydro-6-deoxyglucose reductase, E3
MPPPPTFDVRLAAARPLSPQVREFTFERVDGAPFVFEAGQWISLALPLDEGEVKRAYSIASPPDGTPRFDLAVTHVQGGPGSSFLHEVELGRVVRANGPKGFFTRGVGAGSPALFVSTGTGVCPLRSMLRDALAHGDARPLWLVFGVRHERDILYREELEALAKAHPNIRVELTLSQPDAGWTGRRGYVQTHVRELWEELAARGEGAPHAYVCGLQRMVGSVRELLRKEMSVPREHVHSERYD